MVARWADWAAAQVAGWPDNPADALPDPVALREVVRKAQW
jgi:hypothetical protein